MLTTKTVTALKADITASAELAPVTVTAQSVTMITLRNPVSTLLKYNFYDDYSYTGVKAFVTTFDNALAYPSGGDPIVQTLRTTSMVTGNKTRVLGTATFLNSTMYYDDKGRPIQNMEDNIKTGINVATVQYQWDGRLLNSNTKHTSSDTGYFVYSIVTKNVYDKIGRVTSIEKKFGSNEKGNTDKY